jgi:hypothetical protein
MVSSVPLDVMASWLAIRMATFAVDTAKRADHDPYAARSTAYVSASVLRFHAPIATDWPLTRGVLPAGRGAASGVSRVSRQQPNVRGVNCVRSVPELG